MSKQKKPKNQTAAVLVKFFRAESREEAESILSDFDEYYLFLIAPYFAENWGRMPDKFHNLLILSGGEPASKYLDKLGDSHGREDTERYIETF